MIKRILFLSGISIAVTLAQAPSPAKAKPAAKSAAAKPTAAKPAAAKPAGAPFIAPKTPWGEPDLQGIWPLNHLIAVGLQRNARFGDKAYLTDAEVATAQTALEARNGRFSGAAIPVADTSTRVMKQTSLIVDPPNGQFPPLTDAGKEIQAAMRSSYRQGQTVFDAVEDFSAWDRCVTRGMPVSMEPRNYNNGIRITQSPGYVVILLEMAHEVRIIPTTNMPALPADIKEWMGESRGHWEGNTLVVETKNFNGLVGQTSAGVPGSPGPLQPETTNFHVVERFTRTAADTIEFKMTVDDPQVMKSPYTVAYPMYLDNKYDLYEYACHEGNTAVRNYIEASRFERTHPAAAPAK
ncbi:MAG: hypothetical protein ABI995_01510 [Acidobacteriota bacterium]